MVWKLRLHGLCFRPQRAPLARGLAQQHLVDRLCGGFGDLATGDRSAEQQVQQLLSVLRVTGNGDLLRQQTTSLIIALHGKQMLTISACPTTSAYLRHSGG